MFATLLHCLTINLRMEEVCILCGLRIASQTQGAASYNFVCEIKNLKNLGLNAPTSDTLLKLRHLQNIYFFVGEK